MKRFRLNKTAKILSVVAVGIVFAIFVKCQKREHSNPLDPKYTGPPSSVIAGNVQNLDSNVNISSVDTSGGVFTINYTGEAPNLQNGSILTGSNGDGYLRKVVSVQQAANNQIICRTEEASLTEAVVLGGVDTTMTIEMNASNTIQKSALPGVNPLDGVLNFSNVILYKKETEDGKSIKAFIEEGSLTFVPKVEIGFLIKDSQLETFRLTVGGEFDLHMLVAVEASKTWEDAPDPITLIKFKQVQYYQIGVVPVIIVITESIIAGIKSELTVQGTAKAGVNGKFRLDIGQQYDRSSYPPWQNIFSPSGSLEGIPPTFQLTGDATIKAYVKPKVMIELYAVAGPYINLGPYLRWHYEVERKTGEFDWLWNVFWGIDGEVGIDVHKIDKDFENPKKEFPVKEWQIGTDQVGSIALPELSAQPGSLDYGHVAIDSSKSKTIQLINNGTAELHVLSMTITDHQFTVIGETNFKVPAGGNRDVTIQFKPTSSGVKQSMLQIQNNANASLAFSVPVSGFGDTPPIASFSVTPVSGTVGTKFIFNATGSRDVEDAADKLKVRWDWENDGDWDTGYLSIKDTSHVYTTVGTKTVKLEVMDSGGIIDTLTKTIQVMGAIGTLKGKVTCEYIPLQKVTIDVFDENNRLVTQTTGNYDGTYELNLPVNVGYKVSFTKEGYYPNVFLGIYLAVNKVYPIDVDMERTFSLSLNPTNITLLNGGTQQFTCTLTYSDNVKVVAPPITWSVTPGTAGTINQTGFFTAHASNTGVESVKAALKDQEATTSVTVQTKPVTLTRIEILPSAATIKNKETQQFNCWAHFSDQSKLDVTNSGQVSWSLTPAAAGSFNKSTGVFTAHDTTTGTETISAIYLSKTAQATVTVQKREPVLTGIEISPSSATLYNSQTQTFTCMAVFDDGTKTTLITGFTWSLAPGTAGSFNKTTGVFTAHATNTGTETISATYLSKTAQATVTVQKREPVLTGIEISPNSATLYNSQTQTFICKAIYDDGTKSTLTTGFTWSLAPGTAGSFNKTTGVFTAHATNIGEETITATYLSKLAQAVVTVEAHGTETGTVTDRDGNVYRTVKIGNQWWMAENLKVTQYRNGEPISPVAQNSEWSTRTAGAYCSYDNNANNTATYGLLYNWYAVNDARNIAPEGWHVPSDAEWKTLEMTLGMSQATADATGWRGTDEGNKMKETGNSHWQSPSVGTNASGFSGLPGGYRIVNGGFDSLGYHAFFWSSAEYSSGNAWDRILYFSYSVVGRSGNPKRIGYSVRCVRD